MRNLILAVLFLTSTITLADDKRPEGKHQKPQAGHAKKDHAERHSGHRPHVSKDYYQSRERGRYNAPPQHNRYYRPQVGFRPVIQWLPSGFTLNIGRATVGPNRRYVRFGINAGFYQTPRFHTFNYHR